MTTPPAPVPPAGPAPQSRVRDWLSARFRTAPAVYGLIVFTAIIIIADDKEDTIWSLLLTAVGTLIVFYIAHVFASMLTSQQARTRDTFVHAVRHSSGMLYASIPTTLVLVVSGLDDGEKDQAIFYAMLIAVVTLGILGYAAYDKPGRHVLVRLLGALGSAALGFAVILLEVAIH